MPIPSIQVIQESIRHLPISAISNWLRAHEKPSTKSNLNGFARNLNRWIQNGDLTASELEQAIFDIEESGGKKIYLRIIQGTLPQNSTELVRLQDAVGVPIAARSRRSLKTGSKPILNHMIWLDGSPPYIVIKFSELQEDVKFDAETREYESIPRPVFIVVNIDVTTGFAEFRFDTPAKVHTHKDGDGKSSVNVYENYYFDRVSEMLRGTAIEHYGLDNVAQYLVEHGIDFFRIHREQTTTTGNGKQTYACVGDVRDLPARRGAADADGRNWIYDDITGYWKASASSGQLTEDLFMRMLKSEGSVKFERDCLGKELNYAIKKIRDIKAQL